MTFRYIALVVVFLLLAAYAIARSVLDFLLALWGLS
jgi:hypothetical protein